MNRLFTLLILFCSCSSIRTTRKNSLEASHKSEKAIQSAQIDLKTGIKQREIYGIWKDSIWYQYELVREQVEEARLAQVKENEQRQKSSLQRTLERLAKPAWPWILSGILIALALMAFIFYKAKS